MDHDAPQMGVKAMLTLEGVQALIPGLAAPGYQVLGPTLRDGAIVHDTLAEVTDLPAGCTDQQDAGTYRSQRRADQALFGYAVGPHSWKRFLHPPIGRMWQARCGDDGFAIVPAEEAQPKLAFIGVRCGKAHAIAIPSAGATRGVGE